MEVHGVSKVGIVMDGSDAFFRPIEAALRQRHQVSRFQPRFIYAPVVGSRLNRLLLKLQLAHFLRAHDVVFFEWASSLLVLASNMRQIGRIVTRLHSFEVVTAAHLVNWAHVNETIVVSRHMYRRLLDVAVVPPLSVHAIHSGVDLGRYRPTPRTFAYRIGMACRVVPLKRVYEAILTLAELRKQGQPFTLHIAGKMGDKYNPRYALALESLVTKLNLTDYVTFYGHVDVMQGWFGQIDIFLSNSYWESLGMALLEAMASGCYCLSHCRDGAEEVLPSDNIFTTDADLRAKLLAYAALPQAQKQHEQERMRAIAEERFDEQRMVRQIIDIIETEAAG